MQITPKFMGSPLDVQSLADDLSSDQTITQQW